jgi:hypothetical protein
LLGLGQFSSTVLAADLEYVLRTPCMVLLGAWIL